MPTRLSFRPHRLFRFLAALCPLATWAFALALWPYVTRAQQPAPQKFTLTQIEGLVAHNVPDPTLANQVRLHGLAFAPTETIIDELRTKGAGPLTLVAIGESIHKPNPSPNSSPNPSPAIGGDLLYIPSSMGLIEVSPGESRIRRDAKTTLLRNDDVTWNAARREFYVSPRGAGGQEISVISRDSFTEIAKLKDDCTNTYAVRAAQDGRRLFLTCDNGNLSSRRLIAFDLAARTQIATVPVNGYFISPLGPHGDRLYLSGPQSSFAEYDADLRLLRQQSLPDFWPRVFSPDGQFLFGDQRGKIVRVSIGSLTIDKSLALPEPVSELLLSTDGRYVFASGLAKIYRAPLSLDSYVEITPPHFAEGTFKFADSGDEKFLYVLGAYKEGILWVIDEGTSQVVKTINGMTSAQAVICVPGTQTTPRVGGTGRPGHGLGSLEVHTEPGGQLLLDTKPVGIADSQGLLLLQQVPAGNHDLVAQSIGYQDAHVQFSLTNNEAKQLSLPLVWLGGYLSVSVQPSIAIVNVSGPKIFQAGSSEIQCPAGTYTVTASSDGYLSQTRTVHVAAGEHHSETFELVVDPAVLLRKLDGAKSKLAAGDPAGAEQDADAVLAQSHDNPDAAAIVAESAFQQGDMNRFVDAGARAILGGKQVTVRMMHAHTVLAMWIHSVDITISESGISLVSNPPDSRCKIPPSVGFDLIQSAQVVRDPQRGFLDLHIQYASKPHGAILHDLDFVPEGSQTVATRQPGQVFGSGASTVQEPGNAAQTLDGILRLMLRARR
jgi:hypothetical protein